MFPYLVYMIYIATNRKLSDKHKRIVQLLITLISFLLLIKYGRDQKLVLLLLNILTYKALINKSRFAYFILVGCIIIAYSLNFIGSFT